MRDILFVAARALQQHSHAHHGHSHGAHADRGELPAELGEPTVSTLDLRIAAVFVIWMGAVLFGLPTLVFKQFRSQDAVMPRMIRAFAGGTIVALALVHIIPEAVHQLEGLVNFHLAGCTVLFGIVVLVLLDNCLAAFLAPESYKEQIRMSMASPKAAGHGCHSHAAPTSAAALQQQQQPSEHSGTHKHDVSNSKDAGIVKIMEDSMLSSASSHNHQCLRSLSPSGWISSASAPMRTMRQYITAYTMELGCIFHSVIIGISVGVILNDRQLVIKLMIALAIHQGLEALALGSVLAMTDFHFLKKVFMMFLYTITTPIGVAIGISIASTYDLDSITSKAVQGTFNGVSSGMLLYIGMYQLIAEEFSREDLLVMPKLRFGMYAALLLGAAAMSIIGIWA